MRRSLQPKVFNGNTLRLSSSSFGLSDLNILTTRRCDSRVKENTAEVRDSLKLTKQAKTPNLYSFQQKSAKFNNAMKENQTVHRSDLR